MWVLYLLVLGLAMSQYKSLLCGMEMQHVVLTLIGCAYKKKLMDV